MRYFETRIQEIKDPLFDKAGIRLLIKREDENHPAVFGNKWWKLKYNLEEAKRSGYQTLMTFGGAYSNHIYTTAVAAKESGFRSVGIIRGEETLPLNIVLSFAVENEMKLHYVSRAEYRRKVDPDFINELKQEFGDFYLIPEGGSNALALKGCAEFAEKILSENEFDYLFLPVGTGGTIAGMIAGLNDRKQILGVSVLKEGEFLDSEIRTLIRSHSAQEFQNWSLLTSYHHGGYAKATPELFEFIKKCKDTYDLPLDWIYTGKMVWAIFEEVKNKRFRKGTTIMAIHTGGLLSAGVDSIN